MTRLVSALEDQGLVERAQSPEDGRAILLRATSKGRRIMDEGRRRRVAVLARELEMLPDQELRDVARTLDVIERVAGVRHWPLTPEKK